MKFTRISREELEERRGRRGERPRRVWTREAASQQRRTENLMEACADRGDHSPPPLLALPSQPLPPSFHIPRAGSEQRRVEGHCAKKTSSRNNGSEMGWEPPSTAPWLQEPLPCPRADGRSGPLCTDHLSPTWPNFPAHVT